LTTQLAVKHAAPVATTPTRIAAVLAAAAVLGAGPAASAFGRSRDEPPRLDAVVGTNDAFDIALNGPDGTLIKRLAPGTYTVVVHDRSRLHNFHLASNEDPTVDFRTELEFVGDQSFTVTFKEGVRYVYACEPHWRTMFDDFVVTSAPPPAPPPPPAVAPVRLRATVSAAGVVTLTPRSVRRGRAQLTVTDRSAAANLHLTGPGVDRRTGRAFTGRATWNLRLRPGTYRFGSDPRLGGRLRVR
jgi:plastocyanin